MATQPTNPIIRIAESDVNLPSTGQPNKNVPSSPIQTTGYDDDQVVTAEELNYIFDNFGEWLDYLVLEDTDTNLRIDSIETNIEAIESTSIIAGNGITGGGDLTTDRTLTLGIPSTLSGATTNSITSDSHTHVLDMASQAEAEAGVDINKLMSPEKVHQAVPFTFSPSTVSGSTDTVTLPNGLIMKFEILTESTNNTDKVLWSTPFPNGVLSIQVTPIFDSAPLPTGGNVRSYDRFGLVFSCGDDYGQGTTGFVYAIGY